MQFITRVDLYIYVQMHKATLIQFVVLKHEVCRPQASR